MSSVKMNIEILNVIHAVLDYRKFLISQNMIFKNDGFDWFQQTEKYYNSLPLPKGLNPNRVDFEKILSYKDQEKKFILLDNTAYSDLHYYDF